MLYKSGTVDNPPCDCGEPQHTVADIVRFFPLRKSSRAWENIMKVEQTAVTWLTNMDLGL